MRNARIPKQKANAILLRRAAIRILKRSVKRLFPAFRHIAGWKWKWLERKALLNKLAQVLEHFSVRLHRSKARSDKCKPLKNALKCVLRAPDGIVPCGAFSRAIRYNSAINFIHATHER